MSDGIRVMALRRGLTAKNPTTTCMTWCRRSQPTVSPLGALYNLTWAEANFVKTGRWPPSGRRSLTTAPVIESADFDASQERLARQFAAAKARAGGKSATQMKGRTKGVGRTRGNTTIKNAPQLAAQRSTENDGLCIVLPNGHADFKAVARFNSALRQAARGLYNDSRRKLLWKSYKELDEDTMSMIPAAAWDRLWITQSSFRPTDMARLPHMRRLLKDMETYGSTIPKKSLNLHRSIHLLEDLFANRDRRADALLKWEELYHARNRQGAAYVKSWLELGARLYSLAGDLQRAQALISEIGHRFHSIDPRLALVLVLSFNQERTPASSRKAWGLYTSLKGSSKMTFTFDDLSAVFDSFIEAEVRDPAIRVLVDILRLSPDTVPMPLDRVLTDKLDTLLQSCHVQSDVDECSLLALSILPERYHDKSIFDCWLKRSKRTADADGIAKILDFMLAKGVMPSTWQLNQLLQVWLTSGNAVSEELAERTALQMIRKTRGIKSSVDTVAAAPIGKVPAAAASTFIKLAHFYATNKERKNANTILDLLSKADVKMADGVISGVLSIYYNLKDFSAAWSYYQKIAEQDSSVIGFSTFTKLWAGVLLHLTDHFNTAPEDRTPLGRDFPSARNLFAVMTKHQDAVIKTMAKFPIESQRKFHDYIIRAFCLSRDSMGAIIALQTLSQVYHLQPNDHTIGTIKRHIAFEAMQAERVPSTGANQAAYFSAADQALQEVVNSYDTQAAQKTANSMLGPNFYQSIAEHHRTRIGPILSKYMKLMIERKYDSEDEVRRKFRRARTQMDAWTKPSENDGPDRDQ